MPYKQLGVISSPDGLFSLVETLQKLGFDVKAISTTHTETAIRVASDLNVQCVASTPDELLLRKDVDMVIVTCRPASQAHVVMKSLGIGKHVFCSTPSTVTLNEAKKLLQSAEYYPQILSLSAFMLRRLEVFCVMQRAVANGYIGQLCSCHVNVHSPRLHSERYDWLWDSVTGGGVLNLLGSHYIDLLRFVTKLKARRAIGILETQQNRAVVNDFRRFEADDFASFWLKLESDVTAVFSLSAVSPHTQTYEHEVRLTGTAGSLIVRNFELFGEKNGAETELLCADETQEQEFDSLPTLFYPYSQLPVFRFGFYKLLETLAGAMQHYDHDLELSGNSWKQFVPHLAKVASFDDNLYVQHVVSAIRKAANTNNWCSIGS